MNHPEVTRATPADRERVVDTVVEAFRTDPAFRFFFPDDASYGGHAATFARYLFDRRVGLGTVWIVDGGASVAMWEPASAAGGGSTEERPVLDLPGAVIARMAAFDAAVHTALPVVPYWYLGVLATHPDRVGRRWGRAVMAPGLADAATAGLPAYLETANPDNVEMYRRAGWEVSRSLTVQALQVWIMAHR